MKVTGTLLIILALAIGIIPQFTDCESQGRAIELANGRTLAMKCHWTARSELAIGGPLLAVGVMTGVSRRKQTLRSLAIVSGLLGLFAILMPTVLIGVCASDTMLCNVLMKPTLIFTGILTITVSAAVFVLSSRPDLPQIPVVEAAQ